jgi:hypothetical protein
MLFAQFFAHVGGVQPAFLITDSLESHGFYSEEYRPEIGEYSARDTLANTGLLKVWLYGGAPGEINQVVEAYTDGSVGDLTNFAKWLIEEIGATDSECEQICRAVELIEAEEVEGAAP